MDTPLPLPEGLPEDVKTHLANLAENVQLIADMGYGDTALAVRNAEGELQVVADARPSTAVAAIPFSRVGRSLPQGDEPEAYRALSEGVSVDGDRHRTTRGIAYSTHAYPVGPANEPYAVIVRDLAQQVVEAPGTMEREFMDIAEEIIAALERGPLLAVSGKPFVTTRVAGDGVMRVDGHGKVTYASPNAVSIMRLAGYEGGLQGSAVSELPGGGFAVGPVLGMGAALAREVEFASRVLSFRAIALGDGAAVLVEDITEARRREQELKVKEATIREVHHRVKNNLQTIASLLRIQARRSGSAGESRALAEAVERVSSMAVVHELLSASTDETVDFGEVARTVVDLVRRGIAGERPEVTATVEGTTGHVPAAVATSLALVLAELVHNAFEHGIASEASGAVAITMHRSPQEITLTVHDNGVGLPEGFDPTQSAHLGIEIVRTIVSDDLRGSLAFTGGRGTTVTVRVPLEEPAAEDEA